MLHFIDFEVFKHNWLCVIIDPINKSETVIVDDKDKLEAYYEAHKNEIFVGYNIRHYDQYIFKAILCGFDPKVVNDYIIVEGKDGWRFSNLFNKVPLITYDVMARIDGGLKSLEGFMGNNIKETSVSFLIDRPLTDEEIKETIGYCRHDVEQTIEVFLRRKDTFDARLGLVKAFNLPLKNISKTEAQLAAITLNAWKQDRTDEFDISFPDTLKLDKYKFVLDWYKNPENRDYSKSLEIDVAGVPHIFAWGGLHGAINQYFGEGIFINVDVASYYPSLMIRYGYCSRNISDPKKFEEIYHTRLKYKAEKNPLQAPLKLVLNSTYGAMKDKFNNLYDPLQANNVCVGGQLLLLDLIEKREGHCQIIQSNTDGILIRIASEADFGTIDDICYEWEERTGMRLEFSNFHKVFQGDVNNYVIVPTGELFDKKGKPRWKAKGGYVKKLTDLDYDLPIVNKAIVDYMLRGIPVEDTVNNCTELKMFQKIVKVSSKYKCGLWGTQVMQDKCFRVFASRDKADGGIYKQKEGGKPEKFANTPERCFIINEDVNSVPIPKKLDRAWYINMAKARLADKFGVVHHEKR